MVAYRDEHRNSRPVVLASIRRPKDPQEKVSESSAGWCRGAEYCEGFFAICAVYPVPQQRGRQGESCRCCVSFALKRPIIYQAP